MLLRGLSPQAVTFLALQPGVRTRHTGDDVISDPKEIERTLRSVLG